MTWIVKHLAELQTAFLLLTRFPVGKLTSNNPKLADGLWAFPIVGCVIGGIIAGCYIVTSQFMPNSLAAAVVGLTVGLLCTGAIHEDGLADCADGFGGGQNREKKLAIMKDSAIGTYGTLALIMVITLRIYMLSSLPPIPEIVVPIIICAVISRFAMVGYLCFLPAARQEGLGSQASTENKFSFFLSATVTLPAFYMSLFGLIYVVIAILVVAVLWGIVAKYQIGGQTGDVCGAGQLLSETTGWVTLVSIYSVL